MAPDELIRIFHPDHYSRKLGRYTSAAFQPASSGLGLSVFDSACGIENSGSVCNHIRNFYSGDTTIPAVFWRFSADILPTGCTIDPAPSDKGDACHRNITGVTHKVRSKIARENFQIEKLEICDGGDHRPLMAADLPLLSSMSKQRRN